MWFRLWFQRNTSPSCREEVARGTGGREGVARGTGEKLSLEDQEAELVE